MILLNDSQLDYKIFSSKCTNCKHFDNENINCKAFIDIPKDFLNGSKIHLKPLPTQYNDIVFEPID